jgi:hypothetical protein
VIKKCKAKIKSDPIVRLALQIFFLVFHLLIQIIRVLIGIVGEELLDLVHLDGWLSRSRVVPAANKKRETDCKAAQKAPM